MDILSNTLRIIRLAQSLLDQSNWSRCEVTDLVGYKSEGAFIKRMIGQSRATWRRQTVLGKWTLRF